MTIRRLTPLLCALLAALLSGCVTVEQPPGRKPPVVTRQRFDYQVYYVKQGDTLSSIGREFGVPWQRIQQTNQCDPNNLQIGQVLMIPLHERGAVVPPDEMVLLPPTTPAGTAAPASAKAVGQGSLHRGKPGSAYWWPTAGEVSRRFGQAVRGFPEPGIGIGAPAGTEVYAIAAGTVICVVRCAPQCGRGWGNVVVVRHSGGITSWYGQLDQVLVNEKQTVGKGERIGTVGTTGAATQPELALRIFRNDRPEDPLKFLP